MPCRPRTLSKGAIPMEAYCVSKRPPRALYLGLAIVLGMVAVSTVVLTQMGGGLLRDGTYLRLLGYTPSNRGAALTALSAQDATASRGVLSASSAPGPIPAPPQADVARSPSDAPSNSTERPRDSARHPPGAAQGSGPGRSTRTGRRARRSRPARSARSRRRLDSRACSPGGADTFRRGGGRRPLA